MRYQAVESSENFDAWLEARSRSVTATDVARLARGGPRVWAQVKAEKAGHRSFAGNQFTEHGKRREPVIARWCESELQMSHNTSFLVLRGDERFGATPDLLYVDDSLVGDIKTAKGPEWDMPPANYVDQCQWQMSIVGAESAYLVVEFHVGFQPMAMEPTVYAVDRDDERIAQLTEIAERFLAMGEPSVFDLYLADYARGLDLEKAGRAEKEAARELIEKEICARPSFQKHVSDAGSISLGRDSTKSVMTFDEARLREELPDVWARYVREEERTTKGRLSIRPSSDD